MDRVTMPHTKTYRAAHRVYNHQAKSVGWYQIATQTNICRLLAHVTGEAQTPLGRL